MIRRQKELGSINSMRDVLFVFISHDLKGSLTISKWRTEMYLHAIIGYWKVS